MFKLSTVLMIAAALMTGAAGAAELTRVERGNLVLENMPEIPVEITERLAQYQNTRSAGLIDWLSDGSVLISTRFGDTNQIHRVRVPMGARTQITFLGEPVRGASVSPDPDLDGFLYLYDVGGSEFSQVYWFDLAAGSSTLLTDGKSRNGSVAWTNAGDRFAYTSTRRDGRNFDVWVGTPGANYAQHTLVHESSGLWVPMDWSPDDSRLLLLEYLSINHSRIHVLDLASGTLTEVNPSETPIGYNGGAFDTTGEGVYLVHDEGAEFKQLHHFDLESGQSRPLSANIPWDVVSVALTRDRNRMAFVVNDGGRSQLHLRDLRRNRALPAPNLPIGLISGLNFNRDGNRLAMTVSTSRSPSDVFVYDVGRRSLTRWTESEVGGLDTAQFPEPELVRFNSFDGREIPAWVYKPAGEGPHPVVIQIHGGPESQSRPGFSSTYAYWVNELGAAVISPNVRGSSGYGKTYLQLDNGMKREDSVKDIGALLDWIAAQPDLDAERVIVYGGSYGGYMVLASLVHYNDRLLGGIDIVGISNFVSFLENTESYRRDLRRAEYGDERDPAMRAHLEQISPLSRMNEVSRPLFVAQGLNDPRVPASEAEQVVEAVRENGGDVWYLLAKDEGHGFAKKVNRDYFQAASALFMQRLFEQGAP